jgi:hypothetical protein
MGTAEVNGLYRGLEMMSLHVTNPLSKPGKQVLTEIETARTIVFLAPGVETPGVQILHVHCPRERKVCSSFDSVLEGSGKGFVRRQRVAWLAGCGQLLFQEYLQPASRVKSKQRPR